MISYECPLELSIAVLSKAHCCQGLLQVLSKGVPNGSLLVALAGDLAAALVQLLQQSPLATGVSCTGPHTAAPSGKPLETLPQTHHNSQCVVRMP